MLLARNLSAPSRRRAILAPVHPRSAPISRHKLARLFAWAHLWLAWFAGRCLLWTALGRPIARRDLDCVARHMHMLVDLKLAARMPALAPTRNRHGRVKPYTERTLAGARFRRLTRGRTWADRVMAILAFVRDADAHVARQLKRLRRGFTRLRVILPRAQGCALPAPAPTTAFAADSS